MPFYIFQKPKPNHEILVNFVLRKLINSIRLNIGLLLEVEDTLFRIKYCYRKLLKMTKILTKTVMFKNSKKIKNLLHKFLDNIVLHNLAKF